ncbi:hypothetical protein KDW65_19385 [Burkholderia cenocepacia]|nr:hypothetical protein BHQ31_16860 [Burkholderia cenocepacia]MBR8398782.1 hypothetical protein [Burkholderia cenocepacia]
MRAHDTGIGPFSLNSPCSRWRNDKPSRLGSRQIAIFKRTCFGPVGSEDGANDVYNDGIAFLKRPLGQAASSCRPSPRRPV